MGEIKGIWQQQQVQVLTEREKSADTFWFLAEGEECS